MNVPPSTERKLPSAMVTALVALMLALHWWLGVSATREINATTDELAHVTGGFSYWTFNDYRLQPENGNLPQRIAGLPWVLGGARLSTADAKSWGNSNVWILGHRLFYESGNDTDYLLLWSRAVMALLGVALGLLIFAWSRRLWSDAGGLVSLGFYAFCPNFLANAPLATSDVIMTLCLLAACGAYWRQTRRLDWKTGGLSVAIVAVTAVAKFSFGLLVPAAVAMCAVRLCSEEPLTVALGDPRLITSRAGKVRVFLLSALVHGAAAWLMIWACFDFRFSAVGPHMPAQNEFFAPWALIMPAKGLWHYFFAVTRGGHLFPEPFLQGFAYVLYASAERGAFLNGEYSITGWPQFFPYAFLVKTPWPQLLAFTAAGVAAAAAWLGVRRSWRRVGRDLYRVTPLLVLFALYWAVSLTAHLNIGLRHILPTYPVLFILIGLLARPAARSGVVVLVAILAAWNAAESARIRPHYLAYFNAFAGGPENGWRHLVDSSLDWGQDLPGLAAWLKREAKPGEKVYVSYSGSGDIAYEGIRAQELAYVYNFDRPYRWYELEPGLYCVGATMLQNVYSGWRGPWTLGKERNMLALRYLLGSTPAPKTEQEWRTYSQRRYDLDQLRFVRLCNYLRVRRPDGVIGHSIFVYRLDAAEVHAAAYGSMSELAAAMDQAMQARDAR
ncbi:MAG TPA: glycosyltransferase family 39 protein [Opitutaceae bacterium]|nr:glycosyltransferase family 39 protein [Opitutaceae bacterium]